MSVAMVESAAGTSEERESLAIELKMKIEEQAQRIRELESLLVKDSKEELLREMNHSRELRNLIRTANAPIFGTDTQGLVTKWNNKVAELTGWSSEDVMGKSLVDNFIQVLFIKSTFGFFDAAIIALACSCRLLDKHLSLDS